METHKGIWPGRKCRRMESGSDRRSAASKRDTITLPSHPLTMKAAVQTIVNGTLLMKIVLSPNVVAIQIGIRPMS